MAKTKSNALLEAFKKILEVVLNQFSQQQKKRTWHQHVVPYEDGWAVRREGNQRITSKHRKQSTAISKAKTIAKRYDADVVIHREDGTIRDRISYRE